jgi:hypothetical protein
VDATPTAKGAGIYPLRVPFLLVPHPTSAVTAPPTVSLSLDSTGAREVGSVKLANGGIHAGDADVFAWGLRAGSANAGSADLRAVGVQSLTTGLDGQLVPGNDRLLVFAINTWKAWTTPAANEFDIGIDPDASGVPAYIVAAVDHGLVTDGTPDGKEGCFVINVTDLTITEATFIKAPMNSTTLRCGVLASAIGDAGGAFTYLAAAASLLSPTAYQLPELAAFDPFQPALSQGDHLALGPGKSGILSLWVDRAAFDVGPSLGWMIVSPDNAAGPAQAATIPVVAPAP